jgi:RimJ/RimL family protein N-acetyltransferase
MRLRAATPADYAFIRALVQRPEYALYLTDEDETALHAYATAPGSRLLIWESDQAAQAGFALFCDVGHPSGTVELRRLALAELGQGRGVAYVKVLLAYAFNDLSARKVFLDTSENNLRAQKVYAQIGFTQEGRLRQHCYCAPLDRNFDELLYGMLRAEWDQNHG